MTYDWDGRRNRFVKAVRLTMSLALTLFVFSLPLLIFA